MKQLNFIYFAIKYGKKRPDPEWTGTLQNTEGSSSPNHIAICSVGELFGGVERHILGLINGLQVRGVGVQLILFHEGELANRVREQGIEPIILLNRNRSLLATSRQLAHILEQWQIRVVHVHGYKAVVFSALARCWYPFAMVKTEHGLPEPIAGRPISALRSRIYQMLDGVATRMASATVCYVSKELQVRYRNVHSNLPTIVIPNGISSINRSLLNHPLEFREDWFNLAAVGRLDTVKGFHTAIEAIGLAGLSPDIHLHIVGAGPCESELRILTQKYNVSERVHFLGFRRNVYDFIAYCNALLMPSLHEGLPYTLLEAMALSIPIIASRVGGLAEVLQDEVTALLIPPQDVKALAHAILRLYDSPELCLRLGVQGQHVQQAKYSIKVMTESYLAVYRALLVNDG